jgi:Transposase DDE domain
VPPNASCGPSPSGAKEKSEHSPRPVKAADGQPPFYTLIATAKLDDLGPRDFARTYSLSCWITPSCPEMPPTELAAETACSLSTWAKNKAAAHPQNPLFDLHRKRTKLCNAKAKRLREVDSSNPAYLRRIRYRDPETGKNLVFLTNQFALPALTICALYRCRWQVELLWIKQHLRIRRFYGTSENAVRTQIGIAISVYVLVAIIKKKLRLNVSLHTLNAFIMGLNSFVWAFIGTYPLVYVASVRLASWWS